MSERSEGVLLLVVDDDLAIREALAEVLRMEGYRAAAVGDGKQALEYLREHEKPAVILLDLMMPVMNGAQFREQQLREPALATIPVIVFSAGRPDPTLNADAFFPKPVDLEALLATIARLVRER